MIARTPVPLRWSEKAEAEQVCALAMLEGHQQTRAICLVAVAAEFCSPRPVLPPRVLDWFRRFDPADQARRHEGVGLV
jgi:hypothetical protein